MNQIARRLVPRKGFAELLRRPRRRGVVGNGDVHDTAALMCQDHKHKQEATRRGRHDEEVGGDDLPDVVRKERAPRLRRRRGRSRHVLGNRCLRDVETELQEFAVNSRCALEWILVRHSPNQAPHFGGDRRSPVVPATLPCPQQSEALAMPDDDCLRFHDHECRSPAAPDR